jgi:hypothetical protein
MFGFGADQTLPTFEPLLHPTNSDDNTNSNSFFIALLLS